MSIKNGAIVVGFLILLFGVDYIVIRKRVSDLGDRALPVYTSESLAQFNGEDGKRPILLALDGLVYDVSPGAEDFYNPGESYHYLVGKDASVWLHLFGDTLIKKKYQVVGVYRE